LNPDSSTPKKRLLYVGGNYADIPLILAAKKLGYYVITTGNRPSDMGHEYADEYYFQDYSDVQGIYTLAKTLNISAICPCCNDFSALSAAYTAEKLGLLGHDSYENAQIIHHKDRFRNFAIKNDIKCPFAQGFSDMKEAKGFLSTASFPLIIKPVDLTGGKGISVVENENEGCEAIEKAFSLSKAKRIVIEEFLTGSRHGFSTIIYHGKVSFYFADNEHYYVNPFMVGAASTPADVSNDIIENLCRQAEKIVSLLHLRDGIFHIQYILHKNEPIIIEICRRPPGDLYIKLVEYATGVDYSSWILQFFTGNQCKDIHRVDPDGYYTRYCVMAENNGIIKDVSFDKRLEGFLIERFMWWKPGDRIHNFLTDKCGIVFLKFPTKNSMHTITELLPFLISVKVM